MSRHMKVEVFKTNVLRPDDAKTLVDEIHASFRCCMANFDLEDCDRILRIASQVPIEIPALIGLLNDRGFEAEVLSDDIPELLQF